jgi:hypothetical protein
VSIFNANSKYYISGNPLFDIARFITNCADAEVRRECEYNLVNFYFDYLTKKYEDRGEKMKFTREEVESRFKLDRFLFFQAIELYDLALLHQTFLCLIMVMICFKRFSCFYSIL